MRYFGNDIEIDYTTLSTEELYSHLANICLEEIMFSSDAYVCMINLNLHGYKRLHRMQSKKFYNLYLELQNDIVEMYHKILPTEQEFERYKVDNLKNHLYHWNKRNQINLKSVGEIIKNIFEKNGYIPCVAQKMQKIIYRNLIKNERAIQKFEDCDWSNEVIYIHDKYIHDKVKNDEHHEG